MTATRLRDCLRKTFFVLAVGAIAAMAISMAGCGAMPRRSEPALRVSGGVGLAHARGDVTTLYGEETASDDGIAGGARVEVCQPVEGFEGAFLGLRLQGGARHVRADGLGAQASGVAELDTRDLAVQVVLRGYLPIDRTVRAYAEVAGGYQHTWGDVELSGGGLAGSVGQSGDDGGLLIGGGLGLEADVSDTSSVFAQVDYSHSSAEVESFDLTMDDVVLWLGGEFRF